jgi:RES domain
MIQNLVPGTLFYRVTTPGRKWGDVLSGRGALYLPPAGNRYNVVLQQAAYVCDDLEVAVTEFGYYAARDWQDRLGNHHILPVPSPLRQDYILWQFTLQAPTYVVDVENAPGTAALLPPFALLNPSRNYAATQNLANHAVNFHAPGHPTPHPGLKVPAVRSRHLITAGQSNYVLYRLPNSPRGTLLTRWKLRFEFLDVSGNAVTSTSPRVNWAEPRFMLLALPRSVAVAPPAPYALGTWHSFRINHL